jgi:nitroreductase
MKSMQTRRTIRKYTGEQITEEELRDLLLAAMYAPSAWGKRSWEFIVIDDDKLREELANLTSYSVQVSSAPVAIVVI